MKVRSFVPELEAVTEARHFVEDCLSGRPDAEVAALLVTELAANSVLHAETAFDVAVETEPHVHVEVRDGSLPLPDVAGVIPDEVGHRFRLIQHIPSRWGFCESPGGGKAVWFEL